jgi:enterochelin esterase-like enzyme
MELGVGSRGKRIAGLLFAAALTALFSAAAAAGELTTTHFYSATLGRDLKYVTYLPTGYETSNRNYPVLYLLHGAGGNERTWADEGHIVDTVDQLIAAREIPPTLIVMPGCTASWWIDGAKDRTETSFWSDLEPHVRSHLRTINGRSGRLIAGLSAGGYGALRYALKYPERFAAAAALSPAIYSDAPPGISSARRNPPFLSAAGSFDPAAWKALNYPTVLPSYLAQPVRVPLYLMSGEQDEYGIAAEIRLAYNKIHLHQAGLIEMRVVQGGHTWAVWSAAIADALRYMYRYVPAPSRNEPAPVISTAQSNDLVAR